jgi:hypothetical protein
MLQDILCVADREGERVVCVGAGLEHPQLSGAQFTDIARLGRTFAIGQRGQKKTMTTFELASNSSSVFSKIERDTLCFFLLSLTKPKKLKFKYPGKTDSSFSSFKKKMHKN